MTFSIKAGPPYDTPVAPRPKGDIRETATVASTDAWKEIVSYTPTNGKTFALAKILATFTGTDEQQVRILLDSEVVGHYHATGYVMDWFPPGVEVEGDGAKTVSIEAKGTVHPDVTGFILGEES
jgi:hypothetical protein